MFRQERPALPSLSIDRRGTEGRGKRAFFVPSRRNQTFMPYTAVRISRVFCRAHPGHPSGPVASPTSYSVRQRTSDERQGVVGQGQEVSAGGPPRRRCFMSVRMTCAPRRLLLTGLKAKLEGKGGGALCTGMPGGNRSMGEGGPAVSLSILTGLRFFPLSSFFPVSRDKVTGKGEPKSFESQQPRCPRFAAG